MCSKEPLSILRLVLNHSKFICNDNYLCVHIFSELIAQESDRKSPFSHQKNRLPPDILGNFCPLQDVSNSLWQDFAIALAQDIIGDTLEEIDNQKIDFKTSKDTPNTSDGIKVLENVLGNNTNEILEHVLNDWCTGQDHDPKSVEEGLHDDEDELFLVLHPPQESVLNGEEKIEVPDMENENMQRLDLLEKQVVHLQVRPINANGFLVKHT